jgi:16S rRNA (uracil1498-N3)-methyltransferase
MGARARRFRVPSLPAAGTVTLTGAEAHHLLGVLRLGAGDRVLLFDGAGAEADGVIERAGRGRVEVAVADRRRAAAGGGDLTVAAAVPKGRRMDVLVGKCAELGVAALVPLVTARSAVRPQPGPRLDRWRRLAAETSKQCGRGVDMAVRDPADLDAVLAGLAAHDAAWIASPGGEPAAGAAVRRGGRGSLLALVGPEGGFTEVELERARAAGCAVVSLGPLTLRVETAAIALAALVLLQ